MDKQVNQGADKSNTTPTPEQMNNKIPANGVTENPDPRANENIRDRDSSGAKTSGVGSEITDGEDA